MPETVTVAQARQAESIGREIVLQGWVRTRRDSKAGFSFLEINDGSCFGNIQVIAEATLENYESEIRKLSAGWSVTVEGLVREYAPDSRIVLGGHGTMIPGIEQMIEHDHICRGEGVKWFRRLLGEEPDRPFKHPHLPSTCRKRVLGVPLKAEAAVLIPGVGCPNGCRFCSTSHLFNKKYTPYFESGRELFSAK